MQNEKILNLAEFLVLYKDNVGILSFFKDIERYFQASIGGCSCSKKARQDYANYKFIEIISSASQEELQKIKNILNWDRIVFKDMTGNTFREI